MPRTMSVIIPTYNRREALTRALLALDRQTHPRAGYEVIVIDDGSTDGTAESLGLLRFSYRLKLISRPHGGPAAARNSGLRVAEGETALFLNDDCLAAPNLLAEHDTYRDRHGECAVLGHIEWAAECLPPPLLQPMVRDYYFPFHLIPDPDNVPFTFFITGNLSMPMSMLKAVGGFDETFFEAAFEDIELGYRLSRRGLRLRYNPRAVAHHLHAVDFDSLCDRQRRVAYWLCAFLAKHPAARPHYPGIKAYADGFPVQKPHCLGVILSYYSYRGLVEGERAFFAPPPAEGKPNPR